MRPTRHHERTRTLACVLLLALTSPALAQTYPNKPVRLVVGYAPGGPNDTVARIVGQKLSESLGVPVTVDNRPGADSMIGTQLVAKSAPDGHTTGMISASATIHPSVYTNVPYDITKDFSHVTVLASSAFALVVNASLPAKSVKELVALGKARPGQLNFASSGVGGTLHLSGELFKTMAQIEMTHVSYKGGAPAATAVVSGQIELMFAPLGVVMPHVKSGRLRMLAVTSAQRWPSVPDVPTVAEAGLAGYESTGWYGIVAPLRTPPPIVTRIHQEIAKGLATPDVRQRFASFDLEPIGSSPEQMTSHVRAEVAKWARVVRDAKLSPGTLQ